MQDDIFALINRADELYRGRSSIDSVRESVKLMSGALDGAERFEVQWRLARALFFLGQEADSAGSKRQLHAAAIGAGKRAARLSPERVEGHFWLGVNLALFAESDGGWRAALALMRARNELRRAVAISDAYHGAGPLRVLGRLEHKAPRLLGGSRRRSRECFDRALRIAPDNTVTLLYAFEREFEYGDRARAIRMLEQVVRTDIDPEWEFENQRDREIARSLLISLTGQK